MRLTTKEITFASLFGALSFVSGFFSIPVGPVPLTLQTMLVLLSGLLLTPGAAVLSQVLHLLLKLLLGGFQSFLSPSFGFLFGFILAAFCLSAWRQKRQGKVSYTLLAGVGTALIYMIGLPYMAFILNVILGNSFNLQEILMMGMITFLPGDFLKAVAAVAIARTLARNSLFLPQKAYKR